MYTAHIVKTTGLVGGRLSRRFRWECSCGKKSKLMATSYGQCEASMDRHLVDRHSHHELKYAFLIGDRVICTVTGAHGKVVDNRLDGVRIRILFDDQDRIISHPIDCLVGVARTRTHEDPGNDSDDPDKGGCADDAHSRIPDAQASSQDPKDDTPNEGTCPLIGVIKPGEHEVRIYSNRWELFTEAELVALSRSTRDRMLQTHDNRTSKLRIQIYREMVSRGIPAYGRCA